jgi:uncharacterized membrane protein YkvA (DUF1232 family)
MARDRRANQVIERPSGDARARRASSRRSPGLRRLIAALAFMPLASRAPLYARLLWSLIVDSRIPVSRKALLGAAAGYIALGRDVVPDRVPILGQLDDLVVVALATELFLEGLDDGLLSEKLDEVGIPRTSYEEDIARLRRLLPGPVRRTLRRVPGAIRLVADTMAHSGVAPKMRRWLERDGAVA